MAETAAATVTATAPLAVLADGADTAAPAVSVVGLALSIGDRVQVTIRNPTRPLVTGVQS